MITLNNDWNEVLNIEFEKPYFKRLFDFVEKEYADNTVFPPKEEVFNAYNFTPMNKVKVVILGQDPYHEIGQAHGLCFSVNEGVKIPPSLVNIYKELNDDLGLYIPNNGYLKKWADQGVFLLNTVLTVREGEANSHKLKGWEEFTDATIKALNDAQNPIVFMLWGSPAAKKEKMITNGNHLVLKAPHPSPLSAYRGYLGCKHFSLANAFLRGKGIEPIDWQIENI